MGVFRMGRASVRGGDAHAHLVSSHCPGSKRPWDRTSRASLGDSWLQNSFNANETRRSETWGGPTQAGGSVGGKCNLRLTNNQRLLFIRKPNTLIGTSQYKKKKPWQLKYSKVQTEPFVLLRELGDCITCVCTGLCLHRVALQG